MSKTSDSPSIESAPSWKGLIPCVVGGLITSAVLFFPPVWSGVSTLIQSAIAGIGWAFSALGALIGSAFVLSMPVIGFGAVALIFSCVCGLFKYRHGSEVIKDKLEFGVAIGLLSLCVFVMSILGRHV